MIKLSKYLILLIVVMAFTHCNVHQTDNSAGNNQSEIKKPAAPANNQNPPSQNPNSQNPASQNSNSQNTTSQPPKIKTDSKPGFSDVYERGQKRRESIVDKFDDKGNLIERTDKDFDQYGNVTKKNRYTYKFDNQGQRIEQWFYSTTADDQPIMSSVNYIKYNSKGQKIENIFISYDENGNEIVWAKNIFVNDSENRLTQDEGYNKQGIITNKVVYNYVNGMLVSENFFDYDANGKPVNKKTMTYDKFGKVLSAQDEKLN